MKSHLTCVLSCLSHNSLSKCLSYEAYLSFNWRIGQNFEFDWRNSRISRLIPKLICWSIILGHVNSRGGDYYLFVWAAVFMQLWGWMEDAMLGDLRDVDAIGYATGSSTVPVALRSRYHGSSACLILPGGPFRISLLAQQQFSLFIYLPLQRQLSSPLPFCSWCNWDNCNPKFCIVFDTFVSLSIWHGTCDLSLSSDIKCIWWKVLQQARTLLDYEQSSNVRSIQRNGDTNIYHPLSGQQWVFYRCCYLKLDQMAELHQLSFLRIWLPAVTLIPYIVSWLLRCRYLKLCLPKGKSYAHSSN